MNQPPFVIEINSKNISRGLNAIYLANELISLHTPYMSKDARLTIPLFHPTMWTIRSYPFDFCFVLPSTLSGPSFLCNNISPNDQ